MRTHSVREKLVCTMPNGPRYSLSAHPWLKISERIETSTFAIARTESGILIEIFKQTMSVNEQVDSAQTIHFSSYTHVRIPCVSYLMIG